MEPNPSQISQLSRRWSEVDSRALQQLVPLVYNESHRIAQRYMSSEAPGNTLRTTSLVNEANLRLVHGSQSEWNYVSSAASPSRKPPMS